jgi:hypothetical protein
MKNFKTLKISLAGVLSLGLLCAYTAHAAKVVDPAGQEKPKQDDQTPKRKNVAYLGVYAQQIPEVLLSHLNLPAGQGLLISQLAKDSPATRAGLRRHDVLHKVNGHALKGAADLRSLVRSFLPGDTLKLSLIRQGKPLEIQVALGQMEVDEASDRDPAPGPTPKAPKGLPKPEAKKKTDDNDQAKKLGEQFPGIPWQQLPPETATRLRRRLEEMEKQLRGQGFGLFPQAGQQLLPRHNQEMENLRKLMEQRMQQMRQNRQIQPRVFNGKASSVSSQSSMSDGQHTVTLTQKNGDKHLLAKEAKTGKVLFDGPINSKEQRSKIPAEILPKLQRMEKGTRLKLRVQPGQKPKPKGNQGLPEFN